MIKIKTYNSDMFIAKITPSNEEGVIFMSDIEITKHTDFKGLKRKGIPLQYNGKHTTIARWKATRENVSGINLSQDVIKYLEPFVKWAATQVHIDSKRKITPEEKPIKSKSEFKKPNTGFKKFNKFNRFNKNKGFKKKFFKKKANPFALNAQ